jgi:hypothetical protein
MTFVLVSTYAPKTTGVFMKYVSLDLETSGMDVRAPDRILMLSMVVEDTEKPEIPVEQLPNFTVIIDTDKISGNPTALAMNSWLLVAIEFSRTKMEQEQFYVRFNNLGIPQETISKGIDAAQKYKVFPLDHAILCAKQFLTDHFGTKDRITVAGKNVAGFDLTFLPEDLKAMFRHTVIDPGSMFWYPDFDRMIPDSALVMKRAGVQYQGAHDALEDARMVIKALRNSLYYRMEKARKMVSDMYQKAGDGSQVESDLLAILDVFPDYSKK